MNSSLAGVPSSWVENSDSYMGMCLWEGCDGFQAV